MRWPSAYCATSSGIAMLTIRDRTQPALPSLVRIRYQSSNGIGLRGSGGFTGSREGSLGSSPVFDISIQFFGGRGAAGMGGGGILPLSRSRDLRRTGFGL